MTTHQSFTRPDEWRAAHDSEVEFADISRALRALAAELGQEPAGLLHSMAERGLDATLHHLAAVAGHDVEARYLRHHAAGRTAH